MEYEKKGALSKDKEPKKKSAAGGHAATSHPHPHISVHSHAHGHTMHVMHHDGTHEAHHFSPGDTDGMHEILREHLGAGAGADGVPHEPAPPAMAAAAGGGGGPEEEAAEGEAA